MWPNGGFGNEGFPGQNSYQDNYLGDEDFIPFSSASAGVPGSQIFQQGNNQMQYAEAPEGYMVHNFLQASLQSTPGIFDNNGFEQNFYPDPMTLVRSTAQPQDMAPSSISRPILNARAEELRAQLLKKKEELAKSGTPPIITKTSAFKPSSQKEMASLLQGSTSTLSASFESVTPFSRPASVTPGDVEDLITEAKAAVQATKIKTVAINHSKAATSQPLPKNVVSGHNQAASQPAQAKPAGKNTTTYLSDTKAMQGYPQSTSSSEGEIREDIKVEIKEPKVLQAKVSQPPKTLPLRKLYSQEQSEQVEYMPSPKRSDESKDRSNGRQSIDTGDNSKVMITSEAEVAPVTEGIAQGSAPGEEPTLEKFLLNNKDLQDWLDMTGWKNLDYRSRSLNRHRAIVALDKQKARILDGMAQIAALDAKKAKLLDEMTREEGLPSGGSSQRSIMNMFPQSKMINSSVAAATRSPGTSFTNAAVAKPAPVLQGFTQFDTTTKQTTAPESGAATKKRTFKDYEASEAEKALVRSADSHDRSSRRKGEDKSIRSSLSLDSSPQNLKNYEDKDYYQHESRGRSQHGKAYDREVSPGARAYLDRPSARSMSISNKDSYFDKKASKGNDRQFVAVGNYRGKAYDPNYRGLQKFATRGRGRGGYGGDGGDFHHREERPHSSRESLIKKERGQ